MCGVAACQINGVFADIGCTEKRPWYHPVATQSHSVDGWISLEKTCSLMILGKKMWFVFYVTTHTIIHGTGKWISTFLFHENQAFFWIGGFIPLPWMVVLHALDFSFGHQPNRPPPGFFVSPFCHSLPADDKCQGAQVPNNFLEKGLAKWWKIGMFFFSGGPLLCSYKWAYIPYKGPYKWITGVLFHPISPS